MTKTTITDRVNQVNKEINQAYTEFCRDLGRNPQLNWEDVIQINSVDEDFDEELDFAPILEN